MMNIHEPGSPAVRATALTVTRGGRTVLDHLDFDVTRGSVTGLLGPSGCGKSTLMRALVGVQANVTGTAEVLGLPAGHPGLRHTVGYVTQAPSVYSDLTVRENLAYYAAVLTPGGGRPGRRSRAEAVDRALAEVDLTTHAAHLVGNLSGGQRSRVSLGVALLGSNRDSSRDSGRAADGADDNRRPAGPELLILDEPTVGLDPVLRRDLWNLFHRLAAAGTTILVSSHVMDEAERCDQLLLMRDGILLSTGTPAGLRARTGAATVEDAFLRLVEQAAPNGTPAPTATDAPAPAPAQQEGPRS